MNHIVICLLVIPRLVRDVSICHPFPLPVKASDPVVLFRPPLKHAMMVRFRFRHEDHPSIPAVGALTRAEYKGRRLIESLSIDGWYCT